MLTITPNRNRLLANGILSLLLYVLLLCAYYITTERFTVSRLLGLGMGVVVLLLWKIWRIPVDMRHYRLVLGPNGIEGPADGFSRKRQIIRYDKITRVAVGKSRLLAAPCIKSERKDVGIMIHYSISDEDYNRILEKLKEVGVAIQPTLQFR
ncbi:MAG: hypothetical protein HY869_07245 [Chloroflexi bacterium]|nr:hypothetical protein [Chloroflexota bacterium]